MSTQSKLFLLAFVIATLSSGVASADLGLNCDNYANNAVEANYRNKAYGCGFVQSGWSDDYAAHKGWCVSAGVKQQDLDRENSARSDAIEGCRALHAQKCEKYAHDAVTRARRNVALKCGLKGGAFDDNFAGHKNWCMTVPMQVSEAEAFDRGIQIGQCESSVRTYTGLDLQFWRETPLDVCSDHYGLSCDATTAQSFCMWKGHVTAISHKAATTDFTIHLNCVKTGDTTTRECFCVGTCGRFTEIVCSG